LSYAPLAVEALLLRAMTRKTKVGGIEHTEDKEIFDTHRHTTEKAALHLAIYRR
jgi:hypothetical protein